MGGTGANEGTLGSRVTLASSTSATSTLLPASRVGQRKEVAGVSKRVSSRIRLRLGQSKRGGLRVAGHDGPPCNCVHAPSTSDVRLTSTPRVPAPSLVALGSPHMANRVLRFSTRCRSYPRSSNCHSVGSAPRSLPLERTQAPPSNEPWSVSEAEIKHTRGLTLNKRMIQPDSGCEWDV
jgi:hypothetical protein